MTKVGIVIVSFQGESYITACLDSINEQHVDAQIFIVDNNSSDRTIELIKASSKEVELIELETNCGFGKANNIGISKAIESNVDFVYLLNQDGRLTTNALDEMIKVYSQHPEYGILSPMHYNNNEELESNFKKWFEKGVEVDSNLVATNFVNAAHWLLSSPLLKYVGGFNPLFFVYGEDNNFVHRTLFNGFKIGICQKIRAYHDTSERVKGTKIERDLKKFNVSLMTTFLNPLNKMEISSKLAFMKFISLFQRLLIRFKLGSAIKLWREYSNHLSHRKEYQLHRAEELKEEYPYLLNNLNLIHE